MKHLIMGKKAPLALVEPRLEATLGLDNRNPGQGLDDIDARTEPGAMPRVVNGRLYHDGVPRGGGGQVTQLCVREGFKQTQGKDHRRMRFFGIHDVQTSQSENGQTHHLLQRVKGILFFMQGVKLQVIIIVVGRVVNFYIPSAVLQNRHRFTIFLLGTTTPLHAVLQPMTEKFD
jgi:hypothetical protein